MSTTISGEEVGYVFTPICLFVVGLS